MCSDDILGCELLSHLARQAVGDAPVLVDLRQLVQLVRAGGWALLLLLHLFEDVGLLSIPACQASGVGVGTQADLSSRPRSLAMQLTLLPTPLDRPSDAILKVLCCEGSGRSSPFKK